MEPSVAQLRPGQLVYGLVSPVELPGKMQAGRKWVALSVLGAADGQSCAGWVSLHAEDGSTQLEASASSGTSGSDAAMRAPGSQGSEKDTERARKKEERRRKKERKYRRKVAELKARQTELEQSKAAAVAGEQFTAATALRNELQEVNAALDRLNADYEASLDKQSELRAHKNTKKQEQRGRQKAEQHARRKAEKARHKQVVELERRKAAAVRHSASFLCA